MNRKYLLVVMVMVLLPVLILTGCGGGTATTTSPTTTTPPTTTPTTTPPTTTTTTPPTTTPTTTPPPTTTTETTTPVVFTLTSTSFEDGEEIPREHGLYTGNKSPQLSWSGAPEGTVSFVLIVEDPDATIGVFTHWVVFNIPADVFELAEGQPLTESLPCGALQGMNDFSTLGYGGPAPPFGVHRFYFHLYALDITLDMLPLATHQQIRLAMEGHMIDEVVLMGTYAA